MDGVVVLRPVWMDSMDSSRYDRQDVHLAIQLLRIESGFCAILGNFSTCIIRSKVAKYGTKATLDPGELYRRMHTLAIRS